jgi:hypothetical protein
MEIKLTRFVGLFLVLLSFNATLNIADEVLSPIVRLYSITNSEQSVSIDQEFKVNKHIDFALMLTDTFSGNKENQVLLVEVDEGTYYRAKEGDKAFVYITPIFNKIRFCLDENHPVLANANPFVYKYPREISHFGLPIFVLILAIWTYKMETFEFKFAFFVFTSIFSIIQQWFFR